jgi:hypothetical protein
MIGTTTPVFLGELNKKGFAKEIKKTVVCQSTLYTNKNKHAICMLAAESRKALFKKERKRQ